MKIKSIIYCSLIRGQLLRQIMRTFIFLLCTTVFSFNVENSFSQEKVTIDRDQLVKADRVFKIIQEQTNFDFIYPKGLFKNRPKVQLEKGEILAVDLMQMCLENAGLNFEISENNTVIIKETEREISSPLVKDKNQGIKISGNVTDSSGQPLPGANIIIKGTSKGVVTDFDGKFSLELSEASQTLVISYIGFITREVPANGKTVFNIVLQEDAAQLDEVVLIGYGSQSRGKVLGSISKVNSETITKYVAGSFEHALAGNVAGLSIVQGGKNLDDNASIIIRGIGSISTAGNPLIVVDGVPLTEGTALSSINPNDIESVNVLKDAASAAIYGSRGANGVIIIKTKLGRGEQDLEVNLQVYTSMQYPKTTLNMVGAYDGAQFGKEARDANYLVNQPAGGTIRLASDDYATRVANGAGANQRPLDYFEPYLAGVQGLTDTNWENEVFSPAQLNNYYLSLNGGTKKTNYSASIGYLDQEGIVVATDLERITSNLRMNTNISDKLKFGTSINISYSDSNIAGTNTDNQFPASPSNGLYFMHPYFQAYNDDGSLALQQQMIAHHNETATPGRNSGSPSENVLAMALLSDNTETKFRMFGNMFMQYDIMEGLSIKTLGGIDVRKHLYEYFRPELVVGRYRNLLYQTEGEAEATETTIGAENLLSETTINYNKSFGDHNLDVLGGFSFQQESYRRTIIESQGFEDNQIRNIYGGSEFSVPYNLYAKYKWAQVSYFGRVQYDFAGKYLVSASLRTDGSSKFGDDTKWGVFPSASVGWKLSEESFFPENDVVNNMKLRFSWGETGNNEVGAYESQSLLAQANLGTNTGFAVANAPNADLSWESRTSTNYGVDFGLFQNKMNLSLEYYVINAEGLLLDVPVPAQSGFDTSFQNIGEIENSGFEVSLSGNGYNIRDLEIGFNSNFSMNKSEVLALGPDQEQILATDSRNDFLTKVGGPLADIYVYRTDGVYKSQEEIDSSPHIDGVHIGDYKIVDTNGDGVLTTDDKEGVGTYAPKFSYAFGANLKYKNFDFSFQFEGIEGRKVVSHIYTQLFEGTGFHSTVQKYFDNRWHPENNPDGIYAQPNRQRSASDNFANRTNMDVFVQDGDYFRLRTVQLGYNFSENLIKKLKLSRLRLYFSANNLFTITKYVGINAEASNSNPLKQGFVRGPNVVPMVLTTGLNVTF